MQAVKRKKIRKSKGSKLAQAALTPQSSSNSAASSQDSSSDEGPSDRAGKAAPVKEGKSFNQEVLDILKCPRPKILQLMKAAGPEPEYRIFQVSLTMLHSILLTHHCFLLTPHVVMLLPGYCESVKKQAERHYRDHRPHL